MIDDEEDDFFFFVIDDVFLDEVGIYICKVINNVGEVVCEVEFKLKESIVVFEFIDEEEIGLIIVVEGGEVILFVVVKGKFCFDVEWFKNDKLLKKISCLDVRFWDDKFFLVVMNVLLEDFGFYKCVVSSRVGCVIRIF